MCGIAGILSLNESTVPALQKRLDVMNQLIRHRGPDGDDTWVHPNKHAGLMHRRLAIIDLSPSGAQPMTDRAGNWIVYNGEIYNYIELRQELGLKILFPHPIQK